MRESDIVESDETLGPSSRTADGMMHPVLPKPRPQLLDEEQKHKAAEEG